MLRTLLPFLVAVALTGTAHAAPRPALDLQLQIGAESISTDGERWALVRPDTGPASVLDTRYGTRATVPAGCDAWYPPRSGRLLVQCGGRMKVLELAAWRLADVTGVQPGDQLDGVGAHWLHGGVGEGSETRFLFLNWRTGERRTVPFGPTYPTPARDLDAPALPLAQPLVRAGRIVAVDSPDARVGPPSYLFIDRLVLALPQGDRVLRRACTCASVTLSEGWLTWAEGATVYAHDVRRDRTFSWMPTRDVAAAHGLAIYFTNRDADEPAGVAHTAGRIFASYRTAASRDWWSTSDGPSSIAFAGRLPRR